MTRNARLFRSIADEIENHPNRYNQGSWVQLVGEDGAELELDAPHFHPCNTRACIAGWAVLKSVTPLEEEEAFDECRADIMDGRAEWETSEPVHVHLESLLERLARMHAPPNEEETYYTISSFGRDLLGLTDEEAGTLFNGNWSPGYGFTVPEVLRLLADGWSVYDLTHEQKFEVQPAITAGCKSMDEYRTLIADEGVRCPNCGHAWLADT